MKALAPIGLVLLAGCAAVERAPDAASARAPLPPAFALAPPSAATTGAIADLLPRSDPAFAALAGDAMRDAPTLAAAIARVEAARAGVRAAGAAQLPQVNASGAVSRDRINPQQFGGALPPGVAVDRDRTSWSTGISAAFDLDLFGRLRADRRAAAARLDAASADAAGVRVALEADIARAVIDFRTAAARERIVRADIARAEDLVSITAVRSRAGIAPEFDLVRARSLQADAQGRLQPLIAQQAQSIGQLVTLTARPAQAIMPILRAPFAGKTAAPPLLSVPSVMLAARPDVAAAEARLRAADADIASAAADRFPRLSVTATLGLFAFGLGNLFDDDALTASVGGGLAGPLLDFGRIAARIDQRQASAREAFAGYRGALFGALGDVEAALGSVAAADARAAALTRQATLDADAAGLARVRYRQGLDSFLTVIDAERTQFTSQALAAEAQGDAARARIALYRAIGGSPGTT